MNPPKRILPIIVFSQFCGTSLWFATNAVIGDMASNFHLGPDALGNLTSAIQFGFIGGTLLFAVLSLADRFSPSKVFFASAVFGALFNLATVVDANSFSSLMALRFATGFFLAGIYPVGMKIAADYFQKGLGKSLGFLVGALVLGTAFPHVLKSFEVPLPWKTVLYVTSGLALLGGLLIALAVPDGPYRSKGQQLAPASFFKLFKIAPFRAAAFGYFGHMWELYAFWAFVPVMLSGYMKLHTGVTFNVPLWSFLIIATGSLACIIGGYASARKGTSKVASWSLAASAICCLLSPLFFSIGSAALFLVFLFFWGMVVIADSPLFSTLVAQHALPELKGTALTIVNCIGFAITIVSIQLLSLLQEHVDTKWLYLPLALGPALGLWLLYQNRKKAPLN